jgi:histidinol phosphatase-like PHP family hydrolase
LTGVGFPDTSSEAWGRGWAGAGAKIGQFGKFRDLAMTGEHGLENGEAHRVAKRFQRRGRFVPVGGKPGIYFLSLDANVSYDRLNEELASEGLDFTVFKGIESDILPDGSLDYPDVLLEGFDFVIASVHSALEMPTDKMTERFVRAIGHPATRMIGHPTGRLLLRRGGSSLDMDRLIDCAARSGTAIEIIANPRRLDLDWSLGNKAREAGLLTSINPDAHSIRGIDDIRYGVMTARKAMFEKERVLNTLTAAGFRKWLEEGVVQPAG